LFDNKITNSINENLGVSISEDGFDMKLDPLGLGLSIEGKKELNQ
jgi:hypothetical protein